MDGSVADQSAHRPFNLRLPRERVLGLAAGTNGHDPGLNTSFHPSPAKAHRACAPPLLVGRRGDRLTPLHLDSEDERLPLGRAARRRDCERHECRRQQHDRRDSDPLHLRGPRLTVRATRPPTAIRLPWPSFWEITCPLLTFWG